MFAIMYQFFLDKLFSKAVSTKLNPSNAKLHPICHLLALIGAHSILHVSRIRVNVVWEIVVNI